MANRHIWAAEGTGAIPDLLGTLFAGLLLGGPVKSPLHLYDPYLSDFCLFNNELGQFSSLFGGSPLAEKDQILFSEALWYIASRSQDPVPVRIVTLRHAYSDAFVEKFRRLGPSNVQVRIEGGHFHEKGLLSDRFYVEGSINFTYSGVTVKHEKVVCTVPSDPEGRQIVDRALIEFERRWSNLGNQAQAK